MAGVLLLWAVGTVTRVFGLFLAACVAETVRPGGSLMVLFGYGGYRLMRWAVRAASST